MMVREELRFSIRRIGLDMCLCVVKLAKTFTYSCTRVVDILPLSSQDHQLQLLQIVLDQSHLDQSSVNSGHVVTLHL